MKRPLLITVIALFAILSFAAIADEAEEPSLEEYWEGIILDYDGDWIPPVFAGIEIQVDESGVESVIWPAEFDWSAVDAFFTQAPEFPFAIKANCGGGCNVMLGSYWFDAYDAAPSLD